MPRTGSSIIMVLLTGDRVNLGEITNKDRLTQHYIGCNNTNIKIPLTVDDVFTTLNQRHISYIAKFHLLQNIEYGFDTKLFDVRVFTHRLDVVQSCLSLMIARKTGIYSSTDKLSVLPFAVDIKKFTTELNARMQFLRHFVDTNLDDIDFVISYENDLSELKQYFGYSDGPGQLVENYPDKNEIITNYNELINIAAPYSGEIDEINDIIMEKKKATLLNDLLSII